MALDTLLFTASEDEQHLAFRNPVDRPVKLKVGLQVWDEREGGRVGRLQNEIWIDDVVDGEQRIGVPNAWCIAINEPISETMEIPTFQQSILIQGENGVELGKEEGAGPLNAFVLKFKGRGFLPAPERQPVECR